MSHRGAFEAGSAWNGASQRVNQNWTDTAIPDSSGQAEIFAARASIIQSPTCEWIIDLTQPDTDYHQVSERQRGYRRAGDYIAARSHTLVAATEQNAEVRTGGTMDTLARREEQLARRYASWPPSRRCSTVWLEIGMHKVSVHQHEEG